MAACCCTAATCTRRIVSETTRHIGDVTNRLAEFFCKPACALCKFDTEVTVTREPSRHGHATYGDDYQEQVQLLAQITSAVQVHCHTG